MVRRALGVSLLLLTLVAVGCEAEPDERDKFVQLCESRGGRLDDGVPGTSTTPEDANGCVVKYGKRSYEAPMNPWDGGFNPIELSDNREDCRSMQRGAYGEADADGDGDLDDGAATTGRVDRYIWHPDTGVCEVRRNAIGLMRTRSGKVKKVPRRRCDAAYPDVCLPSPPPDLECDDEQVPEGPFRAKDADPHRLDRNKDGYACEPEIPDVPSSPDVPDLPDYDLPGIPGE